MTVFRRSYLLSYDPLAFHAYLETIIASNSTTASGTARQHQSPWLFTDAANIIFQMAKRRCYVTTAKKRVKQAEKQQSQHEIDDEDVWAILDEMEGRFTENPQSKTARSRRKKWLPEGMDPVLEELPKWSLLAEVLKEIEEVMFQLQGSTSFRE